MGEQIINGGMELFTKNISDEEKQQQQKQKHR
jgi:hypothetical protein